MDVKNNKGATLIPIDDVYYLGADKHSWKILKRESASRLKAVKWYSSLEAALNGLVNFKLRLSGATSLLELQDEQRKIITELCATITKHYKVGVSA